MSSALLGIDTGGTFTDFVLLDGDRLSVHKVLSRPDAPQEAILQGIDEMGLTDDVRAGRVRIIHGTTVATNAALEHKGVRTAYVTNRGLGDVLLIGRQTRAALYDLTPRGKSTPIDRDLTFEVDCRIDAKGNVITPLSNESIKALADAVDEANPEAVAINLLFSFIDDSHEVQLEDAIKQHRFVSRSSAVLPEYREYERGMTTWINAWLGPIIHRYLTELADRLAPAHVSIMQSSGLTVAADQAATRAVNLLLSGPAGGLSGSMYIGRTCDLTQLLTFDMGGTSTDVALLDGDIKLTSEGRIGEFPVGVPMADIHTIGAGGGSIAWIDDGGLLQVGPESAGASPGPACYGKGGTRPTVTDANLVLGRLRPDAFLGGSMSLDADAATAAIEPLAHTLDLTVTEVARGIIDIANEHMTQALRVISIQRGFDPRQFTLTCFGGAGGLHFCDLAENLEMTRCIVPTNGGVLSAFGMLTASPGREIVRTHTVLAEEAVEEDIGAEFDAMKTAGEADLDQEAVDIARADASLDLRYAGQTFTINIPYGVAGSGVAGSGVAGAGVAGAGEAEARAPAATTLSQAAEAFGAEHERLYGHRLQKPVEIVNLRMHIEGEREPVILPDKSASAGADARSAEMAGFSEPVPIVARDALAESQTFSGPMLITERHSTTLVKAGWLGKVDKAGNLLLERSRPGEPSEG